MNATTWLLALAVLGSGCSTHPSAPTAVRPAAPGAESPEAAVRMIGWCWNHRDIDSYTRLLTEDFGFGCAAWDTAGNMFRNNGGWDRDAELTAAQHLFFGYPGQAAADRITLQLDPTLRAVGDSRPGKDPRIHKEIVTSYELEVSTPTESFRATGGLRIFVVRGDSAAIPPDLIAQGVKPDSTRWYIARCYDETFGGPVQTSGMRPARSLPSSATTWCRIKAFYR
jgi:hypothetical protein